MNKQDAITKIVETLIDSMTKMHATISNQEVELVVITPTSNPGQETIEFVKDVLKKVRGCKVPHKVEYRVEGPLMMSFLESRKAVVLGIFGLFNAYTEVSVWRDAGEGRGKPDLLIHSHPNGEWVIPDQKETETPKTPLNEMHIAANNLVKFIEERVNANSFGYMDAGGRIFSLKSRTLEYGHNDKHNMTTEDFMRVKSKVMWLAEHSLQHGLNFTFSFRFLMLTKDGVTSDTIHVNINSMKNYHASPNHSCAGMYQYPGMYPAGMPQTPPWMQTHPGQNPYMGMPYPNFPGHPFGMMGFQGPHPSHPVMPGNHFGDMGVFNLFKKY